jgi:uncharacterized protein YegL
MNHDLIHIEFADNPEPRCPCVLVLDTSGSMHGNPITQLELGLNSFKEEIQKDLLASKRIELAIITYGGAVKVLQPFITVDDFNVPYLEVTGLTPMGQAINQAIDLVEERKDMYKLNAIQYYRPWIFLITDGAPTDDTTLASQRVESGENSASFSFFAVGVEGADMETLNEISSREAIKLKGLNFRELFVWLSKSLESVSYSKVGEQVPLTPPGWAQV